VSEVGVHEAKTHLSRLLEEVEAGEEVILAKAGKPVAKLSPIGQSRRNVDERRLTVSYGDLGEPRRVFGRHIRPLTEQNTLRKKTFLW